MSGGLAFVLDEDGDLRAARQPDDGRPARAARRGRRASRCATSSPSTCERTGSTVGQRVLDDWDELLPRFVKIFPTDYKRVLAELAAQEAEHAGDPGQAPRRARLDRRRGLRRRGGRG